MHGYRSHAEAVAMLRGGHAVFVPLHTMPGESLVVPGKLYEALASGRPVLAALPPGDGADLVEMFEDCAVVPPCNQDALADALERLVCAASQPTESRSTDRGALTPFSRRELCKTLVEVLERTLRGDSLAGLPSAWKKAAAFGSDAPARAKGMFDRA
jgi:glycosyltransferase involved in cell wall biosynthesis